jgi:hypothetical protein
LDEVEVVEESLVESESLAASEAKLLILIEEADCRLMSVMPKIEIIIALIEMLTFIIIF